MRSKQVFIAITLVLATVLAGCTTSGLSIDTGVEQSEVVEDVSMQIARNGSVTMTVVYAQNPTIEEKNCFFNPATKTTQCNYPDHDVEITETALTLSSEGEDGTERTLEPVERDGQTATFRYDSGTYTEVTIESYAVGMEGHEWGETEFGFEVDSASQSYVVENSTWYDERF